MPPALRNQPLAVVALDTDEDIIDALQDAAGVLIVTNLQFEPSRAALQKADEVRRRIRSEMAAAND